MIAPSRPPWMADLPNLYKPFHALAAPVTIYWRDGQPEKPITTDPRKSLALAVRRRCSMCGYPMQSGLPVYHMFADYLGRVGDPRTTHPGGLTAVSKPGPMHKSCAIYSACRCPFMKYPASRSRHQPRNRNRGHVEIAGFARYGIVYYDEPNFAGHLIEYGLVSIGERYPYGRWENIAPLYDEAVATDAETIDMSQAPMHWTDSQDHVGQLNAAWRSDGMTVSRWASRIPGTALRFFQVP